jgi:hypothetical protein
VNALLVSSLPLGGLEEGATHDTHRPLPDPLPEKEREINLRDRADHTQN